MVPANIMLARAGAFQTRKEHRLIDRDLERHYGRWLGRDKNLTEVVNEILRAGLEKIYGEMFCHGQSHFSNHRPNNRH